MAESIRNAGLNYLPKSARTQETPEAPRRAEPRQTGDANGATFQEVLQARQGLAPRSTKRAESGNTALASGISPNAALGSLRFSGHAQTRLQSRNIALTADHIGRLQDAVGRAAGKGARDALVLMDDLALVVSVKNKTVVTVVDKDNLKSNVFTNIDSAVIA